MQHFLPDIGPHLYVCLHECMLGEESGNLNVDDLPVVVVLPSPNSKDVAQMSWLELTN
jgi:hypothetical protein